ncbi:DUF2335 domain-containing protein [Parapedobacter lycopersici]|uniref:DUF2335 domain-containing protein n=1 Tax=Parapedobacter lycopersici TaxID=1864939 RepID=UPI00214D335A|nr:DUF2335 domain-containing protein [Parapedobacter lycopersici]
MSEKLQPNEDGNKNVPSKFASGELSKAEKILKKQDPSIFTDLSPNKKQAIIRATATIVSYKSHSGPLPDAETLREYSEIIPDGAERIMRMAEKEQTFRHDHHREIVRRGLNQSSTGQILGFILCVLLITGGIYLAINGNDLLGFAAIIVPAATLASAFIFQKKKDQKAED